MPRLDFYLSKLLALPPFPLFRWSGWTEWCQERQREARRLALLLATSLRESFEEMRLNPLGEKFLGPLPSQDLWMFQRVIYPMVGWVAHQRRFIPNWEVEKIVCIPLGQLLNSESYACYRLSLPGRGGNRHGGHPQDFPCFVHHGENEEEHLWGATFRIVMAFLELVFGFTPPPIESLPVIEGSLDETYLNGPE